MLNTAKYIAEQKMKAYDKIHIPTKDEVMEDIIAIGKTIAGTLDNPKPLEDVYAVFVENNNRDLEFCGYIGDGARTIDVKGNLLHIGDVVEMTCKNGAVVRQYVTRLHPMQKSINFYNAKVVKSYKEFLVDCNQDAKGIFCVVSCLDAYLESIAEDSLK